MVTFCGSPPKAAILRWTPFEGLDLVHQAVVAGHAVQGFRAERRVGEIAEDAKPVVDRHHHDAFGGETRTVIEGLAAGSRDQRAAVDPDDDRRRLSVSGRPDVQRQAVLAGASKVGGIDRLRPRRRLDAGGAEGARVAKACPPRRRRRRPPAARPHRRRGIGQPLEGEDAVERHAGQIPGGRLEDGALALRVRRGGDRRSNAPRDKGGHSRHEGKDRASQGHSVQADHRTGSFCGRRPRTRASQKNRPMART